MRRLAAIACLLAPLAAPAAAAAAPERPPLQARLVACTTGPGAPARRATFTASMPAVARTARMAIRFDLLQRMEAVAERGGRSRCRCGERCVGVGARAGVKRPRRR